MEAILKAEGTGLGEGPGGIEVCSTGGLHGRAWIGDAAHQRAWSVRWLVLPRDYVGAVAARGDDLAVRMRRFV